jgi:hypothetical protein
MSETTTETVYTVCIDHTDHYIHEVTVTASSAEEASDLALSRLKQFGADLFTETDYFDEFDVVGVQKEHEQKRVTMRAS